MEGVEITRRVPAVERTKRVADVVRYKSESIFEDLGDESRLARNLPAYRKIQVIGRGAFGKAYLVETLHAGRHGRAGSDDGVEAPPHQQRVLKKVPLMGVSDQQRDAAFREALLMRKISQDCPFITQFTEVFLGKGGQQLCLVMEYCSGGDLRAAMRDQDGVLLAEEVALSWVAQIGMGLHHCHSRGVLHRDVKPENCFFRSPGGHLLLGDFGISCSMDERSFAMTCVGSPLYLSPEIVNQDKYSYTSDVWSLGVMLYEVATLEPPFKGANVCQVAYRIVTSEPAPLDAGKHSSLLQRLIDRLLVKDPLQRITLEGALLEQPLFAATTAVAAKHGIEWPPRAKTSAVAGAPARRGLVSRIRGHIDIATGLPSPKNCSVVRGAVVAGAAPTEDGAVEYDDDFHADEDEDGVYGDDDFEPFSGSEASYEADFEEVSDDSEEERKALARPPMEDLSEARVREQLRAELGDGALEIAEKFGVFSFIEGMRISAALPRPAAVR